MAMVGNVFMRPNPKLNQKVSISGNRKKNSKFATNKMEYQKKKMKRVLALKQHALVPSFLTGLDTTGFNFVKVNLC